MTLRAAIVGLSWIGADPAGEASDPVLGTAVPYSHASAYAAVPDVEVVAGCDIAEPARERFVERWGARWPGLAVYADHREMLAAVRPDIVSVVTPDHLHRDVVLGAVDAGVRGIFCEKPIAVSLAEADEMVRAVRRAGVAMTVNYTRRWSPEYLEARRLVRAGAIGRLSQIVAVSGGPRAMLWRNHTHLIDLLGLFADAEPAWAWAELEPGYEGYGTAYRGSGGADPSTEPGANVYVAYGNGVRAYATGMKDTPAGEPALTLLGPAGKLVLDVLGVRLVTPAPEATRTRVGAQAIEVVVPRSTVSGMAAAVGDLLRAMATGEDTQSPPESARAVVAVTDAILRSQAGGNVPVPIDAPPSRS
jgi:predicted dehydrogenase